MTGAALDRLFRPRSIAVVGASADATKLTGRPIAYLEKFGYAGAVWPVNPRGGTIASHRVFADVASLPAAPDVGLVLTGPELAIEAVGQLAARGAAAAIVIAGGFGEGGPEGEARQARLRAAAGGMRLLGPNTIGLVNLTDGAMLSVSTALEIDPPPTGSIAVVSQSGGILGSLLSRTASRGIGLSKLVATGNEADLDVADCLEFLIGDDATTVAAMYLEGLRNPARFRDVAARFTAAGKQLVVFKIGRSEAGARSAVSHTGALAGEDRVYDALFRAVGAIRAQTYADLLDIPVALATGRRLRGPRVAVITSTGGAGTLVTDACGVAGLDLPDPDGATAERLRALDLKDASLDHNPIDVTLAGLRPDLFRGAIGAVLDGDGYDAAVVVVGSSGLTRPDLVAAPVLEAQARSDKPLLVYVSPDAPNIIRHLTSRGVPAFAAPEACAVALTALHREPPAPRRAAAAAPATLPAGLGALPAGPLNEAEAKRLFAGFGIPSVREIVAATPAEAATAAASLGGGPVVLKILARAIAHKTEVGGVALDVPVAEVEVRAAAMLAAVARATAAPVEGLLVQERLRGGTEMILGFHRDPQLGPAILLGLGGTTAELFADSTLRLAPVDAAEAAAMLDDLEGAALLRGWRGRPPGDVAALAAAVAAFSRMVTALGDRLVEAEINPLFVMPEGVVAADGLVVLR